MSKVTRWTGRVQARPYVPRPNGGYKSKEEMQLKQGAYRLKMKEEKKKKRKPVPNKKAVMTAGYCTSSAKHLMRAW